MAICYDRLFHLMIDKKISNAQLKEKAGFSANWCGIKKVDSLFSRIS